MYCFSMAESLDIMTLLARRGVMPAGELLRTLDTSRPTLSRLVKGLKGEVVRIGRRRGARYGVYRRIPGIPSQLPVYRVNQAGLVERVASLHLLAGGGWHWLEQAQSTGDVFEGLPPVVADMAPQGYLGRRFADIHAELGVPRRLQDWNDDHRLMAVARRGEDCAGDLIIGEESLDRFSAQARAPVAREDYPRLARAAAAGAAGSSAGGEQAKFTAWTGVRHVIVKFTLGDDNPTDQRWRDLLACESLALEVLQAHGIPAVVSRIVDVGTQRFLEVERFDRVEARGRRSVFTAGPLDDSLYGQRDNWPALAGRLARDGLLTAEDARRILLLEAFGELIGNSDRHFGNLAFFSDGLRREPRLELAPAYDMLPMAFAPQNGIVPDVPTARVRPRAQVLEVWPEAAALAAEFWQRVAGDERISPVFRKLAARPPD